jgi:uncharacterized membrane protein
MMMIIIIIIIIAAATTTTRTIIKLNSSFMNIAKANYKVSKSKETKQTDTNTVQNKVTFII